MRWLIETLLLSAIAVQQPAPPAVQQTPKATVSNEQLLAQSAGIGRLLYVYDRAAWVSSDALTAAVPKEQLAGHGGGYIVEPLDPQTLRVTYYRDAGPQARAFFLADVREGKVTHQELLAEPAALTAWQATLANAREVAARAAQDSGYRPCTPMPFNTVELVGREHAPVAVYLMTAQQTGRSFVIGGNYRIVVGTQGEVLAKRPYNVSCLDTGQSKIPAGAKQVGVVVNHLLDPVPTELHVFQSYAMRLPIYVTTPDKRTWRVAGSEITPAPATP